MSEVFMVLAGVLLALLILVALLFLVCLIIDTFDFLKRDHPR